MTRCSNNMLMQLDILLCLMPSMLQHTDLFLGLQYCPNSGNRHRLFLVGWEPPSTPLLGPAEHRERYSRRKTHELTQTHHEFTEEQGEEHTLVNIYTYTCNTHVYSESGDASAHADTHTHVHTNTEHQVLMNTPTHTYPVESTCLVRVIPQ